MSNQTRGLGFYYPELQQKYHTIRGRCYNKNRKDFHLYGGRGIKMLFSGPQPFIQHLLDLGYKKGSRLELDRIDNNGHYEPGNLRWVDPKTNQRNKRTTIFLTAFGITKSCAEWAEDSRATVPYKIIHKRAQRGLPPEACIIFPFRKHFKLK